MMVDEREPTRNKLRATTARNMIRWSSAQARTSFGTSPNIARNERERGEYECDAAHEVDGSGRRPRSRSTLRVCPAARRLTSRSERRSPSSEHRHLRRAPRRRCDGAGTPSERADREGRPLGRPWRTKPARTRAPATTLSLSRRGALLHRVRSCWALGVRNPRTCCRGSGYQPTADQPPSEAMTWPVIQSASSLTSQAINRAVSAGVLHRPPGLRAMTEAVVSASA
jgi:hypothetical protein